MCEWCKKKAWQAALATADSDHPRLYLCGRCASDVLDYRKTKAGQQRIAEVVRLAKKVG